MERPQSQFENNEYKDDPLTFVTAVSDPEEDMLGAVFDPSGVMRIKKGHQEIRLPQTPEELRSRLKVYANGLIFARYKASSTKFMGSFEHRDIEDHVNYILGEHIYGLESRDANNKVVGRASWALIPAGKGSSRLMEQ